MEQTTTQETLMSENTTLALNVSSTAKLFDVPATESSVKTTDDKELLGSCIYTRKMCKKTLTDGIKQDPTNATNTCELMQAYVGCYLAAQCPASEEEEKQLFLNKTRALVKDSNLPCEVPTPTEGPMTTEGHLTTALPTSFTTGEGQATTVLTNLTIADTDGLTDEPTTTESSANTTKDDQGLRDCKVKQFNCQKQFRISAQSGDKSPENICKFVNTYAACMLKLPCLSMTEEKFKEKAQKFLQAKSPNCVLDVGAEELITIEASIATTAAAGVVLDVGAEELITIEASIATTAAAGVDCNAALEACRKMYKEQGSRLVNAKTACSNAKDYVSCVYDLPCEAAQTQRKGIFQNTKAVLTYTSPGCDIDAHEKELLAQDMTTLMAEENETTELASMATDKQTTEKDAMTAADNGIQTTANPAITVENIATTIMTEIDDSAPPCPDQLQKCMGGFLPKIQGGPGTSIDSLCGAINDLLSCVNKMTCPEEQKTIILENVNKQFAQFGGNPCEVPAMATENQTTEKEATTADNGIQTTANPATTVENIATTIMTEIDDSAPPCTMPVQKCMDVFLPKIQGGAGTSINSICGALNELVSCVNKMTCPEEQKTVILENVNKQFAQFGGNPCEVPAMATEKQTTEKDATTTDNEIQTTANPATTVENIATTIMTEIDDSAPPCTMPVQKCMDVFLPKIQGGAGTSIDSICGAHNELVSCVNKTNCPTEEKIQILDMVNKRFSDLTGNPCG
ncbi:hypothetical protein EGW08_023248, partial [Elysia chlorotica]